MTTGINIKQMQRVASFFRKVEKLFPHARKKKLVRIIDFAMAGVLLAFIALLIIVHFFLPASHTTTSSGYGDGENRYVHHTAGAMAVLRTVSQQVPRQTRVVTKVQAHTVVVPGSQLDPLGGLLNIGMGLDFMAVNNAIFQAVWNATLMLTDLLLVFTFFVAGYSVMAGAVGLRYADAVETLPRIVLAGVAAHASLVIVQSFVDLEIGMTGYIHTLVSNLVGAPASTASTVTGIIGEVVGGIAGITTIFATGGVAALPGLIEIVLVITLVFMVVALLIQFFVRGFSISLLGALGPLGLGASGLPHGGGRQITGMWLSSFMGAAFSQFLQVSGYIVAQGFINLYLNAGNLNQTSNVFQSFVSGLTTAFSVTALGGGILPLVLQIAVVWFVLRIPSLTQSVTAGLVIEGGSAVSGSFQSSITTAISTASEAMQTAISMAGMFV